MQRKHVDKRKWPAWESHNKSVREVPGDIDNVSFLLVVVSEEASQATGTVKPCPVSLSKIMDVMTFYEGIIVAKVFSTGNCRFGMRTLKSQMCNSKPEVVNIYFACVL